MDSRFTLLDESGQFSRNIALLGVIRQLQRLGNLWECSFGVKWRSHPKTERSMWHQVDPLVIFLPPSQNSVSLGLTLRFIQKYTLSIATQTGRVKIVSIF